MRHAACQLRAWLIFDVGQNMIRALAIILAVLVTAATVLLRHDRSSAPESNATAKQDARRPIPTTSLPSPITRTPFSEPVESLPTVAPTPQPALSSIPSSARHVQELRDVGVGSAIAASETFIWATLERKTDIAADMVIWRFFGDSRTAAAIFSSLPEQWRREVQSPERLMALMHQNENAKFEALEVIGHRTFGPTDEEIIVRWYAPDGSTRDESMLMTKVEGTWRREQQPSALKRLVDHLSSQPTPDR
jgi:hypothetical protein